AARLLAHGGGRRVAEADDALLVAAAALARLAAAGGDKAQRGARLGRHRVAEGIERGLRRRADLGANVGAGDRVDLVLEDAPGGKLLDVVPVEGNEARFGKLARRTQFGGAQRGRLAAEGGEMRF